MFAIIAEPTLTHYNHPKSIAYLMVPCWCCTFCGFGQMCNDMYRPLWYHPEYFHCFKNPLHFVCSSHSSQPLATTDLFTFCIIFCFPGCHIVGQITSFISGKWLLIDSWAFQWDGCTFEYTAMWWDFYRGNSLFIIFPLCWRSQFHFVFMVFKLYISIWGSQFSFLWHQITLSFMKKKRDFSLCFFLPVCHLVSLIMSYLV